MSAAVSLSNDPFEVRGERSLCPTCLQFLGELSACSSKGDFRESWTAIDTGSREATSSGIAFKHHLDFDALAASAQTCRLCYVLHDDLAPLAADLRRGWLALIPYNDPYQFRAGFNESLHRLPWSFSQMVSHAKHTFRVGRSVGPYVAPYVDGYPNGLAVAPRLTLEHVAQMYKYWVKTCATGSHWHSESCGERAVAPRHDEGVLPTRVIDLGPAGSDQTPRFYVARPGEKADYVALSHCWGGAIPASTVQGNLEARRGALCVDELPRNFRDAIAVTRVLGIRYLWIDSLCIVQDSPADWAAEAGRMASLYAGATLVLSVLEAPSSDVGFLHLETERVLSAEVNEEYTVQKVFGRVYEYLDECPLNTRAWCMQERVLAPRVLHFGRQQMFWECDSCFTSEVGDRWSGESTGHVAASFMALRKRMRTAPLAWSPWEHWYRLVEEYTTRSLTVGTDKLVAVAGVATSLKRREPTPTYVAGLWREDLAAGLIWGAKYDHYDGRKTWGYGLHDECSVLVHAPRGRAPSWSWASVDGPVIFWSLRCYPIIMLDILNVVMEKGEDDVNESQPRGILKTRGLMAKMVYCPPTEHGPDVGSLEPTKKGMTDVLRRCVMDTRRNVKRECYALLVFTTAMTSSGEERYFLVLECAEDMMFKRAGICQATTLGDLKGFSSQVAKIV